MSAPVTYWQSVWQRMDAVTVFPFASHAPGNFDDRVLLAYAGNMATQLYREAKTPAEEASTRLSTVTAYWVECP